MTTRRTLETLALAALAVLVFPMVAGCDSGDAVPAGGAEEDASSAMKIKFEDVTFNGHLVCIFRKVARLCA